EVLIGRDFDDIYVLKPILPDRLPRPVCPVYKQKLLLKDCLGKRGIEVLKIVTSRDQLAAGSEDPWTADTACIDRVAQFCVAINSGMAKIANRCDAALQVFPRHLRAEKRALGGRFRDGQQKPGRKERV